MHAHFLMARVAATADGTQIQFFFYSGQLNHLTKSFSYDALGVTTMPERRRDGLLLFL